MYSISDKIVHPMHGAGVIEDVITQRIQGQSRQYYVFRVPEGRVTVLIPVDGCEGLGVRALISADEARRLLEVFPQLETDDSSNWNRRYRDNLERLKSGQPSEVARVVKSLMLRERNHTLSSVERRMLLSARQILLSELSLALGIGTVRLSEELCALLAPPTKG